MSSIINALSDLFTSLVELVWSFFTTAGALVQRTVQFTLNFALEMIDLVVNFLRGLVDLAGGIVSFVLGKLAQGTKGVPDGTWNLTKSRQCPYVGRRRCRCLRLPPVPAQPGQTGHRRQQEAKLALFTTIPPLQTTSDQQMALARQGYDRLCGVGFHVSLPWARNCMIPLDHGSNMALSAEN
jgi:hypothetical protein